MNTYARKAAWLAVGCLLLVPHALCMLAEKADRWIMDTGSRMHRWSHPDLYAPRLTAAARTWKGNQS